MDFIHGTLSTSLSKKLNAFAAILRVPGIPSTPDPQQKAGLRHKRAVVAYHHGNKVAFSITIAHEIERSASSLMALSHR